MKKLAPYLITVILIFLGWGFLAQVLDNPILPEPISCLVAICLLRGKLLIHLMASATRIVLGVGISLILGIPVGLIIGRVKRLDRVFAPFIYLAYPIPKIAFLPLVLLFFGLGNTSKVFLIAIIVFFQVVVNIRDAARNIDQELILSVKSLGAGDWQLFRQVVFPASLPRIFTAIRISTGTAIAVLFFTETFATFSGLGYFIMDAWIRVNYREMFAGIMVLSILGLALFIIIDLLEYLVCPWLYLGNESRHNN